MNVIKNILINLLLRITMSSIKLGYDLSPMTFSPEGRLFQQEYCRNMVKSAPPIFGLVCIDGILLFLPEKLCNNEPQFGILTSNAYKIGKNLIICSNGITGDSDYIIERIRKESLIRKDFYSESFDSRLAADLIAYFFHLHCSYWHLRPLVSCFLLAGMYKKGPEINVISNLGLHKNCHSVAIGENSEDYSKFLDKVIKRQKGIISNIEALGKIKMDLNDNFGHRMTFLHCISGLFRDFHHPSSNIAQNLTRIYQNKSRSLD